MSGATTRSFRAGSWFGVFGDHATVLLPPSEKSRVARLWELVDEGAGFDEVLDELIAGGLRELPGFVLVSESESDTKVVVRGAARASFTADGENVDLEGASATTWVEQTLTSVTSMSVLVGDEGEAEGNEHTLTSGLVRVSRVDVPPRTTSGADQGEGPTPVAAPVPPASAPQPEPEPEPEPDLGPATEAMAAPASPAAPPSVEHDGATRAGGEDRGSYTPPGIPGQPPAPSVVSRPVARLVVSSGETVEVDRAVVIGRAPESRRFPSDDQPRLVTVPSPQQEISSTHLEVRPGSGADHGSATATDLGSTNGTVVVQPGLPPEDLQPGIAVQLIPGAIIDLGDGVTIQVVNP